MPKVKNVFITGANRGIGFHLVKQIISELQPDKIFATYRSSDSAKELQDFAAHNSSVQLVQMDVRNDEKQLNEIVKLVDKVTAGAGLNLLINNAGVSSKYVRITGVKKEHLMESFEINTVAPIILTKMFLPLLEKASTAASSSSPGIRRAAVVNISSVLGSIASNDNGGMYAYRCSKAALNIATKSMSLDFQKSKILSIAMHPGWVQTDMGGPTAPITPVQSAEGIVKVLLELNDSHNGKFLQFDGEELPW